ncbi:MAG: SDR family oxidoreductase [Geminicoccaceae bacterium]
MTRALANALKRDRIRINTLNIGSTDTPREHLVQTGMDGQPENWLESASRNQPFGRLIEPEEVAGDRVPVLGRIRPDDRAVVDFDQNVVGAWDENPGM